MSAQLVELLGAKLLSGTEEVDTASALANKGAVALYFSAHWCPPCRQFTPQLAKWYTDDLSAKGLEVVFVSSDREEGAFKEYFAEQPWKALPFADRDRKNKLNKKFKVQGIPALIILDADGKVITKEGRGAVSKDPKGENFPWKPKSLKEIFATAKLIGKDGPVDAKALAGKAYGLYFSAHWCPPCRGFTPELARWYNEGLKEKMEIVFCSSDKDEASFNDYFKEQPWLALDYSCRNEKEELSNAFGVRGIPSFVVIDADGSVMTKEGRDAVSKDPKGEKFPWYPEPVQDMDDGPGSLNEAAVLVALCEKADDEAKAAAKAAMTPLAKKMIDDGKAKDEDPEVCFMIATSPADGIAGQLRKIMSLPEASASPKLMIINIPEDGAFHEGPEGPITSDAVEKFVADFQAGKLERKQLERM